MMDQSSVVWRYASVQREPDDSPLECYHITSTCYPMTLESEDGPVDWTIFEHQSPEMDADVQSIVEALQRIADRHHAREQHDLPLVAQRLNAFFGYKVAIDH